MMKTIASDHPTPTGHTISTSGGRIAMRRVVALGIGGLLATSIAWADNERSHEQDRERARGAVFVMTNSTDRIRGNEIVMYHRDKQGDLALVGSFPTGRLEMSKPQLGSGPAPTSTVFGAPVPATADALGSSNSLILDDKNRCLFAVNAGSNTVSSFRASRDGLRLVSVVDSRGTLPVSLAQSNNVLYVLNAGNQGNLAGLRVQGNCHLIPLRGSSTDLSAMTNSFEAPAPGEVLTTPAQVAFTPDGKRLVLSIKGGPDGNPFPSGRMAVFPVRHAGLLGNPVVTQFSFSEYRGGPFSFIFANRRTVIVVHANSQTIASYAIKSDHTLSLVSGPFDTGTFAPCWLDGNGRFVYVANFGGIPAAGTAPDGNGMLAGFRIGRDGALEPMGTNVAYPAPGVGHGNHAIDVRVVGRFLYFLQPRTGMVGRLTVDSQGMLRDMVHFGGLLPGAEPYAGSNPGIENFSTRCFLQDPNDPAYSPECLLGSAQGIAGY